MPLASLFRTLLPAALLGCVLVLPAHAAPSVKDTVSSVQKVYQQMKDFRADFIQELMHQESGTTEVRKGTLLFKKPLLVRWESVAPHAELLLAGKDDIWNWLPDEEVAYRYHLDLAKDSRSLLSVLTGQSPLNRDFDVELMQDTPAGEDMQAEKDAGVLDAVHLLLYPKEPTPQMVEVQLWVDPKSHLIRRAQVMDFYGNTNRVTFAKLQPDTGLKAADFDFTPPEGTEVEDHRKDGAAPGNMMLK